MPGPTVMATDEAVQSGFFSLESQESRWRRWAHLAGNTGVLAVVVWVLTAPVAFPLPRYADLDPFGYRAIGLVIATGLLGVAVVTALVLRWPARAWAGVVVALLASWTILAQRTALHGTPFGFGGLVLQHVTACPQKIGTIANAALVLTHFEHRYISC